MNTMERHSDNGLTKSKNMFIKSAGPTLKVIAWMPLPKGICTVRNWSE